MSEQENGSKWLSQFRDCLTAVNHFAKEELLQVHECFAVLDQVKESELDARVLQYAEDLRSQWIAEQTSLRRLHRLWEMKRPVINSHIAELYEQIQRLEQEIDDLLLEKIQSGG